MKLTIHGDKLFLYDTAIDFRLGVDGLLRVITETTSTPSNTVTDAIYIFFNRARDKLKILSWHKNGFMLIYKRFERCKVKVLLEQLNHYHVLTEQQFGWLLAGLEWQAMSDWDDLNYDQFI